MTFGERIHKMRTEKGMTQDELATAVGYKSRSTIAKIEAGKRDAPQSMIVALAKALDTTPAYLMGWEAIDQTKEELEMPSEMVEIGKGLINVDEAIRLSRKNRFLSMEDLPPLPDDFPDITALPLIRRYKLGDEYSYKTNVNTAVCVDRRMLDPQYSYFWFEVSGDSMEPELHKHDRVLIQETDKNVNDCLALVCIDDEEGSIKRINIEANKITVSCVNPYYPARIFENEDRSRITIIGKVIKVVRDIY